MMDSRLCRHQRKNVAPGGKFVRMPADDCQPLAFQQWPPELSIPTADLLSFSELVVGDGDCAPLEAAGGLFSEQADAFQ